MCAKKGEGWRERGEERGEKKAQEAGEVPLEFAEVEADGGEEGVDGTPLLAGESVEAQAVI